MSAVLDLCSLEGHTDSCNISRFSPWIEHQLVTVSDDGTIRMWDLRQRRTTQLFEGSPLRTHRVPYACAGVPFRIAASIDVHERRSASHELASKTDRKRTDLEP